MPQIIDLNLLDGTTGFRLNGEETNDSSGYSVDVIGDVNGDGFADLLIGAPDADVGDATEAGTAYVIFGQEGAFAGQVALNALDGSNGFKLENYTSDDLASFSVSSGDFNGDGFADLLFGGPRSVYSAYGGNSGQAWVFFGRDDSNYSFGAIENLEALNGINGFDATGGNTLGDNVGDSVSTIGDINGDGIDDFVVGSPGDDGVGATFVVFGTDAGFPAALDLATLDGTNGFRIDGLADGDGFGNAVAGADVNGDGLDDLIVGAPYANPNGGDSGETFVLFGSTAAFAANVSVAALDGTNGFSIRGQNAGDAAGASVANAGDVNGDGFEDIIIGAPNVYQAGGGYYGYEAGEAYVVFGSGAAFGATIELSALDGTNGFTINNGTFDFADRYGHLGGAVAGAGDVNGDGFDDVIIGAADKDFGSGEAFLVFGAANFGAVFDLDAIVDTTGSFLDRGISGALGLGNGVGGGEDLNGDGLDDFTIGAPNTANLTGATFFVRGFDSGALTFIGTAGDDNNVGSAGVDIAIGDLGNDFFDGQGGADVINGGAGDDVAKVTDLAFQRVDGGLGIDTFELGAFGVTLDFTAAGDQKVREVEIIDISGQNSTVILDTLSVQQLSSTSNSVVVFGDPTAEIQIADEANFEVVDVSNAFVTLQSLVGQAQIRIDDDLIFPAAFQGLPIETFELAQLDGNDGFRFEGLELGQYFGIRVSEAGDINGDGFEDFIVGAPQTDSPAYNSGEAYVVFGTGAGFNASLLAGDLDGTNGFRLQAPDVYQGAGTSVGAAGDVNGDGFADIIVGSFGGYYQTGEAFVVFGTDQGFNAAFDLNSLDGTNGFAVQGINNQDLSGFAADGAGDINGDGFDDIIVGGRNADGSGFRGGESYVIFGNFQGTFQANLSLADLNGVNGFTILGANDYDYSGFAVASAGDINGDGFADFQIGTNGVGSTFVVFGSDAAGADVDLSALGVYEGFEVINGPQGAAINSAGDVNGDGIGDFIVGNRNTDYNGLSAGSAYVVFGDATPGVFGNQLDLTTLNGLNGFRVDGLAGDANAGISVAGAGDVNGDGFDDIIVGAPGVYQDGAGFILGQSFVLFGSANGFDAVVDPATIDGTNGFKITPAELGDNGGYSVSGAGDLNGDGFDDIIVGAYNGFNTAGDQSGESYVIFGGDSGAVDFLGDENANVLNGDGNGNVIVGGQGDDVLFGGGGQDVLRGGEGNDQLVAQNSNFDRITGGTGFDIVSFLDDNDTLDLTNSGTQGIEEIEGFDLTSASNFSLTFNSLWAATLSNTSNSLTVFADDSDTVTLEGPWSFVDDDGTFSVFADGAITVAVSNVANIVFPDNNDPVAQDDIFEIDEDDAIFGGDVLIDNGAGPDFDVDGDVLTVSLVTDVVFGVLTLNDDGTFDYEPDADFEGTDSFEYLIDDNKGGTDIAFVTIDVLPVNDDPTAIDDAFETIEDTQLVGNVLDDNGLGADFDIDIGDILTVITVPIVDVANGVLALNDDGSFTYDPNNGFVGQDSFTYEIEDGNGGVSQAVVTIDVLPAVADPVAQDDNFAVQGGDVLTGNVLVDNGNGVDFDPNGDPLIVTIVDAPTQGILALNRNGNFTYVGDADGSLDTFTYQIDDGAGGTDTALVTIDLLAPEALNNTAGNDIFNGDGSTIVSYANANAGIIADLDDGFVNGPDVGIDRVFNVFELQATGFDDIIFGQNGNPVGATNYTLLGDFESFLASAGRDIIFGDGGTDRINYSVANTGVNVDLLAGIASEDGFGDTDSLFGVEGVKGTNFNDVLRGDDNDNFFEALRGEDQIDGRGGENLLLYEGVSSDIDIDLSAGIVTFENGDVTQVANIQHVETGLGFQFIVGSGEDNMFASGADNDRLIGLAGDDVLFGEMGDDRLFGNSGDDFLEGGAGDDRLSGSLGDDELLGKSGNDELFGGAGDDKLMAYSGNDELFGGSGDDELFGYAGSDFLDGGAGDDRLVGGGFADTLNGGTGDDTLAGGNADDTFVFELNSGIDTITDFATGLDLINVAALGIENFNQILAITSDIGGRAVIQFNGNVDLVRLEGVQTAQLSAEDFIFSGSDIIVSDSA